MSAAPFRLPFRALGTRCEVVIVDGVRDLAAVLRTAAAVRREVAAFEREVSRFDPSSDLSRLNACAGEWTAVGPRLRETLREAIVARGETGGRFDPTILPALVAAGYDRTREALVERPAQPPPVGWRAGAAIEVDEGRGRARVAAGAAVDLGGIGKGVAALRGVAAARAAWPAATGIVVDLGGDMAFSGTAPDGGPWHVAVASPRGPGHLGVLAVHGGGVATSGRDRRRFFGPGRSLHHLIDPDTGRPAPGPLQVTVVADDPARAEAHATALAIAPADEVEAHLARFPDLGALIVPERGDPVGLGRLPLVAGSSARDAA